jgi:hypothetical protein
MIKVKYEKPTSLDAGQVAAIQGATCSIGNGAGDGCGYGQDPKTIPYCDTGSIATGNCLPTGGSAGQFCNTGNTATMGCYNGPST